MNAELKHFLARNRIEDETWKRSRCDWKVLSAISADHVTQSQMLSDSAALYASLIQRIPGVHSVRWRVKNAEHLLEKIVRKKAGAQEKYADITAENYHEVITDLIGIRALHLFKDDCFEINKHIVSTWTPAEIPVAYIRKGDPEDLIEKYSEHGLEVKVHPEGYRSVHLVISSQPINRKVYAEIQVRTIFEEGWSEIDHKIRYPNFSDHQLVGYFLTIFNRMAGSADEMGSFVTGLAASIQSYQLQLAQASNERDESLKSMENLLDQLTKLKQQDKESKATIGKLQEQVAKMKGESSIDQIFSSTASASDLGRLLDSYSTASILRDLDDKAFKRLDELSSTSNLAKLLQGYEPKKNK